MRPKLFQGWLAFALWSCAAASAQPTSVVEGIAVSLSAGNELTLRLSNGEERVFAEPAGLAKVWPGTPAKVEVTVGKDSKPTATVHPIGGIAWGTIHEISADQTRVHVKALQPTTRPITWTRDDIWKAPDATSSEYPLSLSVPNDLRPFFKSTNRGDAIRATYKWDDEKDRMKATLLAVEWRSEAIRGNGWGPFLGTVLLLLGLAFLLTRGRPARLFLGEDNRYSTSKFQALMWFWVVISAYLAAVGQRVALAGWSFLGGVEIPQNLVVLSGISVLGFAASKAITTGKVEAAKTAVSPDPKPAAARPRLGDLVSDDANRVDLGDFQIIVITLIAVVMYSAASVEFLSLIEFRKLVTLPDVDTALLALFGLGQAAYLGKKAATDGTSGGGTPEQAVRKADDAATSAKVAADRAESAQNAATQAQQDAATALDAIRKLTPRDPTTLEAARSVRTAAETARKAAVEATAAAKAASGYNDEVVSMSTQWSRIPAMVMPLASALAATTDQSKRAATAARSASEAADGASSSAKNAEEHARK